MLSFMTLLVFSFMPSPWSFLPGTSHYIELYGTISFFVGSAFLFLVMTSDIDLFKHKKIEAWEEVQALHFWNFWCDLYNFLIGVGVFCYGLEMQSEPEDAFVSFCGQIYAFINISPVIFLLIFNSEMTKASGAQFRTMLFILQTVGFTIIVMCHQKYSGQIPSTFISDLVNCLQSNLKLL